MNRVTEDSSRAMSAAETQVLDRLCDAGRYLEALRRWEKGAPLATWRGVRASSAARRIASSVGAERLGTRHAARAWREDPTSPMARFVYGLEVLQYRGVLGYRRASRRWPEPRTGTDEERADLVSLEIMVTTELRDFAQAEALVTEAEALAPRVPWVRLQRAVLLERQDLVEPALEVVRVARSLAPEGLSRAAIQREAQYLLLLGRSDEAIEVLGKAADLMESSAVVGQLCGLLVEAKRWDEALRQVERFLELSPRLGPGPRRMWEGRRAEMLYRLGRRGEAAEAATRVGDAFHAEFARRLGESPGSNDRVEWPVPFVRQHFKTCAPATLAALGRYWGMPADHVALAEAICYDGTPAHVQRAWAEDHDWRAIEFRVTWDAAIALLERGVPFAVSTVDTTSAHMQAVIGFDRVRRTLTLRDPGRPHAVEVAGEPFLECYRAFGPVGTVFLPASEAGRAAGLELPDAAPMTERHLMERALAGHRRGEAVEALERLRALDPDGDPVLFAECSLARYDGDQAALGACLDRLLTRYPTSGALLLSRYGALQGATRERRLEFLGSACRGTAKEPALAVELAALLLEDARQSEAAEHWLRHATRWRPQDPHVARVWGDRLWLEGSREEATEWYRWAANLDGFQESLFRSWFLACRATRATDAALGHLRDRVERFGRRSEQPALTLAWAWSQMDRPSDALAVLEDAMAKRPEDGHLRLRTASIQARLGATEAGRACLDAARGRVREVDWQRAAAEVAELGLDHAEALRAWRGVLEIEPLAMDAHQAVVRWASRQEGDGAGLAHLRQVVERFPHHVGLRRMLAEASRAASAEEYEATVRELTVASPSDAWARRELALALGRAGRWEEGASEARIALEIEPRSAGGWRILGGLLAKMSRLDEARTCHRRAIALSADEVSAMGELLGWAENDAARREELVFIREQLETQVLTGDALGAFRDVALPVLPAEELNDVLRQAWVARPDLWQAWSAYSAQLGHAGKALEAWQVASEATRRFPHLPGVWLDLARAHRARREDADELAACERAFELGPDERSCALALGDVLERAGRLDDARATYERALRLTPFDAPLHGARAHLDWRQGRIEECLAGLEHALRLWLGYGWAWNVYRAFATEAGQAARIPEFARRLTRENPGDRQAWILLAGALEDGDAEASIERVAAAERVVTLAPGELESWDLLAEVLASVERFDEAMDVCRRGMAAVGGSAVELLGRQAWIDACRGEAGAAIAAMRAVLEENAGYLWGWRLLASWSMSQGDQAEAQRAMEHVLKLAPGDASAWRGLARVQLDRGQRGAAKESYLEALRLDPAMPGVAETLFALQLEDGEMPGAERTLDVLRMHHPGSASLCGEVAMALRLGDLDAAGSAMQRLCRLPDPDPWPVTSACEAFRKAGKVGRALRVMTPLVGTDGVNPQVAACAIAFLIEREQPWRAVDLLGKARGEAEQDRAASALAKGLGEGGHRNWMAWVLWRRKAIFRRSEEAWGHVGYALHAARRHDAVVNWLADWRQRRDVQPWMLFNLCVSLRSMGRYRDATLVAEEALQRWGHRQGASDLCLFLALENGLAGATAEAEAHLARVSFREAVRYDQQLLALARTLVAVQRAEPSTRPAAFQEARAALEQWFGPWYAAYGMRDARRSLARAGRRLAADGAGWRCQGWFAWRRYGTALMATTSTAGIGWLTRSPHAFGVVLVLWISFFLGRRKEES